VFLTVDRQPNNQLQLGFDLPPMGEAREQSGEERGAASVASQPARPAPTTLTSFIRSRFMALLIRGPQTARRKRRTRKPGLEATGDCACPSGARLTRRRK